MNMAARKLRMLSASGDETLAEWDIETVSLERLREIEAEFNSKVQQGFFAVDITDGRNKFIREFDPGAETLLIPPVRGG
jgi:hypothetical protein